MKPFRRIGAFVASAGVALLLGLPQIALAQSNRTWVSGVGDDANPCSRTAPCKTFAGAFSKTATNGGINCIDPGPYGSVTITKSIVIDCRFALASVLVSGSSGVTINAPDSNVVLRNIDIDGISTPGATFAGIKIVAAASVHVEDVTIRAMGGSGIEFAPNVAPSTGPSKLVLVRVLSRLNAQHGMTVAPTAGSATVAVFDSSFSANSLNGIRASDSSFVTLTNSVLSGNTSHGAVAVSGGGSTKISLDRVTSSSNGNAGIIANGLGAAFYLSNVLLTGNAYGLYPPIGGGTYVSFGNNRTAGNTTSDGSPTSMISQF